MANPVILPEIWADLISVQENRVTYDIFLENRNPSFYNPLLYCSLCGSVEARRPLGSATVLLTGASGSGKSELINVLYGSPVCETGRIRSTTQLVSVLRKEWNQRDFKDVVICAKLDFIDVPGFCGDTEGRNEEHIETIKDIRNKLKQLNNRPDAPPGKDLTFPNVVLFVVRANDEVIGGEHSYFVKTLKSLKSLNFVDPERNNLIVVLTHCMSSSCNINDACKKITDMSNMIKKIVWQYLSILDVDVVPVENKPESFNLPKNANGLYILPNGQQNHQNLLEKMSDCVILNKDNVGELVLKNYLPSANVDLVKKSTLPGIQKGRFGRFCDGMKYMAGSSIGLVSDLTLGSFPFQYLGHGFCPATGRRTQLVFDANDSKKHKMHIGEHCYKVPAYVEKFNNGKTELTPFVKCETFRYRLEYEKYLQLRYNMDSDTQISFRNLSQSEWLLNNADFIISPAVRFVVERELFSFRLKLDSKMKLSWMFGKDLLGLPEIYTINTKAAFEKFFYDWGTHTICEQGFGGALVWEQEVDSETYHSVLSDDYKKEILKTLKESFNSGTSSEPCEAADYQNSPPYLGNRKPTLYKLHAGKLIELRDWSSNELQGWTNIVDAGPAELGSVSNIEPFYNFLPVGPRYTNLRRATLDYLSHSNSHISESLRDTEGIFSVYFAYSMCIRLHNGEDIPVDSASSEMKFRTVKSHKGILGDFTDATCKEISSATGSFPVVKVSFANDKILIGSANIMVWKFFEVVGYQKTQIRFCKLGDVVGCYSNSGVHLRPTKIVRIEHGQAECVVGAMQLSQSIKVILNGFIVGLSISKPKQDYRTFKQTETSTEEGYDWPKDPEMAEDSQTVGYGTRF